MLKLGRELDAKVAEAMGYTVIWADDPDFGPTPYIHDESARKGGPVRLLGGHWEVLKVDDREVEVFCRLVPPFSTDDHEALGLLKLEPMALIPVRIYPDLESYNRFLGEPEIKWVALDWSASSFQGPAPGDFAYLYDGDYLDNIDELLLRDEVRDTLALAICEMFLKRRGVKNDQVFVHEEGGS